jgi:hypothetical protein
MTERYLPRPEPELADPRLAVRILSHANPERVRIKGLVRGSVSNRKVKDTPLAAEASEQDAEPAESIGDQ